MAPSISRKPLPSMALLAKMTLMALLLPWMTLVSSFVFPFTSIPPSAVSVSSPLASTVSSSTYSILATAGTNRVSSKFRNRFPFSLAASTAKSSDAAQSTPSSSSSSSSAAAAAAAVPPYKFQNYQKPILLLGLSSSKTTNELHRLAVSLSGALVGNSESRLSKALEGLERSQGVGLLGGDEDDDDDMDGMDDIGDIDAFLAGKSAETTETATTSIEGISLSLVGLDSEGPFVLDTALVRELIRQKTLGLTSGVLVVDFNHAAFETEDGKVDEELEIDLIRALSSVAKELYEKEGLLSVYVNVESEGMSEAVEKRKQLLEKDVLIPFSDYELCIKNEGLDDKSTADGVGASWNDIEWELQRIIARALLPPPIVGETGSTNTADLTMGLNTFFLSLSFPQVEDAAPYVEQMCQDVDSMEYRVDLLQSAKDYLAKNSNESKGDTCTKETDPRFEILYQQQRLRSLCRPHAQRAPALPFAGSSIIDNALPIVYTVRTAHQAGTWPDDESGIQQMFDLLELGLRSAVEVLDVESAWDKTLTDELLHKAQERYTSLILGSHHVVGQEVTKEEAISLYRQCRMNNRAHGTKVVLSINDNENDKDHLAYEASLAAAKLDDPEIPNIGLILGEHGSYSRILNPRFTPVTHESLPSKAAPGQLTAAEIMAGRLLTGIIPSERYAILGHNIAYSVSPQMQGSAFEAVKLPHVYTRADVETVEEFVEGPIWNDDNFGGCSVTIPHKQSIIPHVDLLTDAAREIGSVNTVICKRGKFGTRVLIGDNTDWKGIYNPLKRRMSEDGEGKGSGKGKNELKKMALILGGGGTARAAAYAASKLGLERVYFNRTPEKAKDLADEFGGVVAKNLDENIDSNDEDSLGEILRKNEGRIQVVMSTLPAAAEFQLPEWLLGSDSLPIVFDVNYKPYSTALLQQATGRGCDVVRGSEMLWEQGVGQFELWTGRTAPYGVMKKVVLENCLPPST